MRILMEFILFLFLPIDLNIISLTQKYQRLKLNLVVLKILLGQELI